MVHTDAENYEGIYFLSDEEVLDEMCIRDRYMVAKDSQAALRIRETLTLNVPCLLYTSRCV